MNTINNYIYINNLYKIILDNFFNIFYLYRDALEGDSVKRNLTLKIKEILPSSTFLPQPFSKLNKEVFRLCVKKH